MGGLAHLINFRRTDTIAALRAGQHYCHVDMAGFSLPASEHSIMTSWLREGENLKELIKQQAGNFGTRLVVRPDPARIVEKSYVP
ncbi:hypothetical protein [Paremcibacter congregatus]|uniref:Nicotinate/nicotinamide phosphoribosyltransferase domain-containing protein n=1 Tax=Paremcibacter congregatus TaxID=2043170 RepID=A0A2G4YR14_9PROT|nr:hypothetical protein [Paremcibacter congregatus]PHZ84710.1 hypothetical protein CRD36_10510 [Paremcibacter congregatus]QDE28905.1 hypothetical protein FIV45_17275 [Paremcibacter congregatus]